MTTKTKKALRQRISHQPGVADGGQTVDPDLNQPSHQIHGCPCLRKSGLATKQKSVQT